MTKDPDFLCNKYNEPKFGLGKSFVSDVHGDKIQQVFQIYFLIFRGKTKKQGGERTTVSSFFN